MVKTTQEEFRITEEEQKLIIQHLATRFCDRAFVVIEDITERIMGDTCKAPYETHDAIIINYKYVDIARDIMKTLYRMRNS